MDGLIPGRPVIIREGRELIPDSLVQSCTECCRIQNPDGSPNLLGPLHRKQYTRTLADGSSFLDCSICPVCLTTYTRLAVDASGRPIYWKGTNRRVTEAELLRLEEDGDDLERYVEVRQGG